LISIKIRYLIGLYSVEPYYFNDFLERKKDKYLDRLNPNKRIEGFLAELLIDNTENRIKILDIGAGPITKVGYKLDNKQIELHPIDPLAKVYNRILHKKKIYPPVKTKLGNVENLSKSYGENEFDLIYANNSIDHTANPLKAIYEIHYVLKPNHYFYFSHFINEGNKNNYYGLHQWNFYCIDDNLFLSSRTKRIELNITDEFRHLFDIEITIVNRRITAKFKKLENFNTFHLTSLCI
jgi:SAM-dependent methyltransferase